MSWLPKQKVVIPVDFSDTSLAAISTAVEMAASPADVHVVHVLVPLEGLSPGVVWGEVNDESREKAVRKSFAEYAAENGLDGVQFIVQFGDPGFMITEYVGTKFVILNNSSPSGVNKKAAPIHLQRK